MSAVFAAICLLLLPALGMSHDDKDEEVSGNSAEIISKYLEAGRAHDSSRNVSMEVNINAAVPNLNEHGQLRAVRKISSVGKITYRVLGFTGDNSIKNQVIARYLQAEQQGQGNQDLAITPANYKFKFKGAKTIYNRPAFLFQLSPRQKKVGLFKGEMWLDAATFLPLFEKGRFVKNPSIFFKRVAFERAYSIENGIAVPQYMSSIIDTHLVGRVALDIFYSNFETGSADRPEASESAEVPR
ncbi:MAG: hypothetical protein JO145_05515 [Acidobacteriaceae bacterium]|nr:hypothetical protein [Acidobacteriaceae bacterium]MBV9763211.1 hypothetical protein [Acidobacteriaceae bacterium]